MLCKLKQIAIPAPPFPDAEWYKQQATGPLSSRDALSTDVSLGLSLLEGDEMSAYESVEAEVACHMAQIAKWGRKPCERCFFFDKYH